MGPKTKVRKMLSIIVFYPPPLFPSFLPYFLASFLPNNKQSKRKAQCISLMLGTYAMLLLPHLNNFPQKRCFLKSPSTWWYSKGFINSDGNYLYKSVCPLAKDWHLKKSGNEDTPWFYISSKGPHRSVGVSSFFLQEHSRGVDNSHNLTFLSSKG